MRISRKAKSIISGILLVTIIAGVLALAGSILGKDTKTISSTAFAVGAIDDSGNFEKSDVSIYTKDMFECQGLSIEPDFEATGTYRVFYYDSNKNFIGATDELNAEDGVYNITPDYYLATYARIQITPDVPVDEDGKEVEDFKIRFYEVAGYANEYTITVNKKQNPRVVGENEFVYHGFTLFDHENVSFKEGDTDGVVASEFVDITGVNSVTLYMAKSLYNDSEHTKVYVYDLQASTKMTILDLTEYDTIDCGDYIIVEIDNLNSFETMMLASFGAKDPEVVSDFKNISLFVER